MSQATVNAGKTDTLWAHGTGRSPGDEQEKTIVAVSRSVLICF